MLKSIIELKEFGLVKGQKFLFVFDFGDVHHFEIRVERFRESEKGKLYSVVL